MLKTTIIILIKLNNVILIIVLKKIIMILIKLNREIIDYLNPFVCFAPPFRSHKVPNQSYAVNKNTEQPMLVIALAVKNIVWSSIKKVSKTLEFDALFLIRFLVNFMGNHFHTIL